MNSLKEATAELHQLAESTKLVQAIFRREITEQQYSNLLINQLIYYSAMESTSLVDPRMCRTSSMIRDLRELANPVMIISQLSYEYADYITTLTPQQTWAHIYVHYLGDMMGGQMLKRCVPGSGSRFDFEDMSELVSTVRMNVSIADAHEARQAFEWTIKIYDDLHQHDLYQRIRTAG